ncbi:hypothetical protein [Stagnihabitans tardus]|nr:hypothetical protein [Stagnihabitans tardus]
MKKLALFLLLAACGAAGSPEAPAPGVTVTGEASAGVSGGL